MVTICLVGCINLDAKGRANLDLEAVLIHPNSLTKLCLCCISLANRVYNNIACSLTLIDKYLGISVATRYLLVEAASELVEILQVEV